MANRVKFLAVIAALWASTAHAQILGAGGPVDKVLHGPLIQSALPNDILNDVTRTTRDLTNLRKQRLDVLRRANPKLIELDPHGDLITRSEAVALSPSPEAIARAKAEGFEIARRDNLQDLGLDIVVLRAPQGVSTRSALKRLRKLDPDGTYDFNHLYGGSGEIVERAPAPAPSASGGARSTARIGLIDGGVDTSHPALKSASITQRAFATETPIASEHGTAVASLIAGEDSAFTGAAPGAQLYAADVFGGIPNGGSADSIARAFGWLAQQRVSVINASLVGPPNATLQAVVRAVIAKGCIVVAAVGNDGPSAPALYPASYPGVIGVTGVDAKRKALIEAARGEQVDFSAPGSDMAAAGLQGYVSVRGTSFAAPIVAGLLAQEGEKTLGAQAIDLGAKGKDKTYGAGLVGESVRMAPKAIAKR